MTIKAAIILAAGKGTRMKSGLVKVLHPLAGRPMLGWPLAAARGAGVGQILLVAGHQAELVQDYFGLEPDLKMVLQKEQLGTGHAVSSALPHLEGESGAVLILCGDTPILTADTLKRLAATHLETGAAVTVLTTIVEDPVGYGRIVRDGTGAVRRIVEQKDTTPEEQGIREINSGIYCMDISFLRAHIGQLGSNNAQNEYYLTDLVGIAVAEHAGCAALIIENRDEIMGVNDRIHLAEAARLLRRRINNGLMESGVTMIDPETTYIDAEVRIGADTVIWPGTVLKGFTHIGCGCILESNVQVTDSAIGNNVHLKTGSVVTESQVGNNVDIGPMAHLRPDSVLAERVKIGNFVETKKVIMGAGSKASHLTYLGDADIGSQVNIGCGTITCNYDGRNKHKTEIGDNSFIGSDVQLVAPVKVGANAMVAAGTTVTENVPDNALALARTRQVNKDGWCLKKRKNG